MVRVLVEFHGYAATADSEAIQSAAQDCFERLKSSGLRFFVDEESEEGKHSHATLRFGFAAKVLLTRREITQSGPHPGQVQDIPTIEDAQVTEDLLRNTRQGRYELIKALP